MKSFRTLICGVLLLLWGVGSSAQEIVPIRARVNVQADTARLKQVVDGRWVGVGTRAEHAICYDYSHPYQGLPSYRFELRTTDNTLQGYAQGSNNGRA